MNSYSLLGVLGVGFAGILAFGACTSNTTVNSSGDDAGSSSGGDDSSVADGASSSSSSSSSSGSGLGSSSGSGEASTDAPVDGGLCTAALTIGSADCDTCMKASCCDALIACDTPDDAGVDDAGNTACESLLNCALTYAATSDAGLSDAVGTCNGGDAATGASTTLTTLLSCAQTNCASQCQ